MLLSYRRAERPMGPRYSEFDIYALTLTVQGAHLLLQAAMSEETKAKEACRMGGVERFVMHNMPELPDDSPAEHPVTLHGTDLYWQEVGTMLQGSEVFFGKAVEPDEPLEPGQAVIEVTATARDLGELLMVERTLHGPAAQTP